MARTGRRNVEMSISGAGRHHTQHGHFDMNDPVNPPSAKSAKILKPRRLALLGTAAALGIALLAGAPNGYLPSSASFTSPAHAAETSATPSGFADLVAKVKPAVISVRVKIDQDDDKSAMLQQNRMNSEEDSPFDQLPREFGFRMPRGMQQLPNGMPRRHHAITDKGSSNIISADGYAVTNNHVVDHAESVQLSADDCYIY